MAKQLNRLETEVGNLRSELSRLERLRDSRDLNLSALENEIEARRDEIDYAKNLLVEFINNQTASADASERQLYEGAFLDILNSAATVAKTMSKRQPRRSNRSLRASIWADTAEPADWRPHL